MPPLSVFLVKNNTAGDIELKDFGIVIPADAIIDLIDFCCACKSEELDGMLASEDLVRVLNGVEVSYSCAYLQEHPLTFWGADTIAKDTSSKTVTIGITMADIDYRVAITPTGTLITPRMLVVTNKTQTQFDVVTMSGENILLTDLTFDWKIGG